MQYGQSAGANAALQQAMSNQMSSMANQMQMHSDAASSYMKMGMQAAGNADWSGVDKWWKKNTEFGTNPG
jgi:hypothetical protein